MPKVEITIPEHLEMQIAQLVEQGEFLNREEAIEDLLSTGLKAYKTSGPIDDEEPGTGSTQSRRTFMGTLRQSSRSTSRAKLSGR